MAKTDPALSFVAEPRVVMLAMHDTGHGWHRELVVRLTDAALVVAVLGLALQQALKPNLSPVSDAISAYEVGSYAYLQTAALWTLGVGSLLIAIMFAAGAHSRMLRCGSALIAVWGVGITLLGIINVNDGPLPTSGAVHEAIATTAFGAAVVAIACVSFVYASNKVWHLATAVSWSTVGLALAALAFTFEDASWFGIVERALGLTIVGWLVAVTRKPVAQMLHGDRPEAGPLDMAPPAPSLAVARPARPVEPEQAGPERRAA